MTPPVNARPSTNPFLDPPVSAGVPEAEHLAAHVQAKPWGHEIVFADGTHGYVGKLIAVRAGSSLSLQVHRFKDETITVVSGEMVLESGPSEHDLEPTTMLAGDTVHVPPGVLHRITAVADVLIAEASTAGPGWRHDVVRLADEHGRAGTSAP